MLPSCIWIKSEKLVKVVLLNFGKIYKVDLWVIFDQRPKLYIGFEAEMEIWILNGIYYLETKFQYLSEYLLTSFHCTFLDKRKLQMIRSLSFLDYSQTLLSFIPK